MACTPLSITVFVLMGLAALFWVVGVATDNMYSVGGASAGLFPGSNLQKYLVDWWKASQAMALLGLLALGGAGVVSLLTLCCKDIGRRIILILQSLALFASAGCNVLCVIIFGAEVMKNSNGYITLGYSYAMICVSAALSAIAGVVCVVDMVKGE